MSHGDPVISWTFGIIFCSFVTSIFRIAFSRPSNVFGITDVVRHIDMCLVVISFIIIGSEICALKPRNMRSMVLPPLWHMYVSFEGSLTQVNPRDNMSSVRVLPLVWSESSLQLKSPVIIICVDLILFRTALISRVMSLMFVAGAK